MKPATQLPAGSLDILFGDGFVQLEDNDGNCIDVFWFEGSTDLADAVNEVMATIKQWKAEFGKAITPELVPSRRAVREYLAAFIDG